MAYRSNSTLAADASEAWAEWSGGHISGAERDHRSAPLLRRAGLDGGTPDDALRIMAERRAASVANLTAGSAQRGAERREAKADAIRLQRASGESSRASLRSAARLEVAEQKAAEAAERARGFRAQAQRADLQVKRDQSQTERAEKELRAKIESGAAKVKANTPEARQRWADAAERTARQHQAEREAPKVDRTPGIEWQGGELRSGASDGHIQDPTLAAAQFAAKYAESTLPHSDILPKTYITGSIGGEVFTAEVPIAIIEELARQAKNGEAIDSSALIAFAKEFSASRGGLDGVQISAAGASTYEGEDDAPPEPDEQFDEEPDDDDDDDDDDE